MWIDILASLKLLPILSISMIIYLILTVLLIFIIFFFIITQFFAHKRVPPRTFSSTISRRHPSPSSSDCSQGCSPFTTPTTFKKTKMEPRTRSEMWSCWYCCLQSCSKTDITSQKEVFPEFQIYQSVRHFGHCFQFFHHLGFASRFQHFRY